MMPNEGMTGFVKGLANAFKPGKARFDDTDEPELFTSGTATSVDRLADWLPYSGWSPERRLFLLDAPPGKQSGQDPVEAVGFVLGIHPQTGANPDMVNVLRSLFNNTPQGVGIQIHLFASPDLSPVLDKFQALRVRGGVFRETAMRRAAYLKSAALRPMFTGLPWVTRNFRACISIVVPTAGMNDITGFEAATAYRDSLVTTLKSVYLYQGEWTPDDLINWNNAILNPHRMLKGDLVPQTYDDGKYLRDQMVAHDTLCRVTPRGLTYGGPREPLQSVTRFFSVRSYPKRYSLPEMGALTGDFIQGALAYPCPFLLTLNIRIPDYETSRNLVTFKAARATQRANSKMAGMMPDWQDHKSDWDIALRAYDNSASILMMQHTLAIFCAPQDTDKAELAARAVWRARGFDLQEDTYVQAQSLMLSLPATLTPSMQQDVATAKRDSSKTSVNAIHMSPLITEWTGLGDPILVLFGRRGQIMGLDLFANPSGNFNAAVVGVSGSGKSVLMEEFAMSYLGAGARVWVADVGGSYKNMAEKAGGQYLEFDETSGLCINPFSIVTDLDQDMEMLKPLIAQMVSPSEPLPQYELAQLDIGIRQVWYEALTEGRRPTLTELAKWLKYGCKDEDDKCDPRVRNLGVQLFPYTIDGAYGRWFNGEANIRFDADLVVLELEQLKSKKDLQGVVLMLLMYLITNEIYLNRENGQKKIVIIDEAWDLMTGATGDFIEAGYRRARKYGGAFITGTQGIDDYYRNEASKAALNNADWIFMLRQKPESLAALEENKRLVLTDGMRTMVASLHTEAGMYSEVFVYTSVGHGIGRLVLDPYSLLLASTRAEDYVDLHEKMAQGMNTDEAIRAVLKDRGVAGYV
jgi:conjugal transfer ATP-binding protein TraC